MTHEFFIRVLAIFGIYSAYPSALYRFKKTPHHALDGVKRIYLTFDDGPEPQYTNILLDLLDSYDIKATFFVVAEKAKQNPEIIRRMKVSGHTIGVHSLEHKNALFSSPSYTKKDFIESLKIMNDLDVQIKYFRPPWGNLNILTYYYASQNHIKMVFWTVMAGDWSKNTTEKKIIKKLSKRVHNNKIICLHDGRGKNSAPQKTIAALKVMIPHWLDEGYNFEKIDEIYKVINNSSIAESIKIINNNIMKW
ncbi:MAG: polysaccharide deacetylase family protein [Eubacteriaceae bacterium]|nr:polysaccharide deacetylase family protein [Eubacteriaceae bacterium]